MEDAPSVHVLRPAPPVRAFAIAAVLIVIGAVVVVTATARQWPTLVTVLAAVLLVLGGVLFAAGAAALIRMRVLAEVTRTGYTFRTPAGVRHGIWADTVKVTTSDSGRRITFTDRDDQLQQVVFPVGSESPEMAALTTEIIERLEATRS